MGWVVNATPPPLYLRKRTGTHRIGVEWAPEPFWTGAEVRVSAEIEVSVSVYMFV
jgi:hypothetical protein